MKFTTALLLFVLFVSCASSKETNYTASTPASPLVRNFLGISLTDSIDFIRWKLSINDKQYSLDCKYGIGKPNTNGFYDEKNVTFSGPVTKDKNVYIFQHGNRTLKFAELNNNLLHVLNDDNTLMIGNGGWSYAINKLAPSLNDQLTLRAKSPAIKDSMAFEGRTPCGVPGIIPAGKLCYKLKWYIVLYGDPGKNEARSFRLLGTGYRAEGGRKGIWKIITGKDGRITYQLLDDTGKPFIYLLKLDEGILIFTDEKGNLLIGDHDFSYTLNRKF